MFKWPWKADDESGNAEMPWEQALAIPVLAHLSSAEQHKLTQMAARFLQQKRLVALQGLELTPLHQARIAMLFCLPVLELGIEWLDGFHEVLIYLPLSSSMMNGRMILVWSTTSGWYSRDKAGNRVL